MKALTPERRELIEALVAEAAPGKITAGLLEKDEYLTDALRALFALELEEGIHLVLCGGTSLSKAYRLIERMSEDADLKVALPGTGSVTRRRLSKLKALVTETLTGIGLVEDKAKRQAGNNNQYFFSEWNYEKCYAAAAGLRPRLQIEWTARTSILPTQVCRITTLADQLADRRGGAFEARVVAVAETVAEKILSFLRRYAQHRAGLTSQWDTALVRHLYDVDRIHQRQPDVRDAARQVFPALVAGDQEAFGAQFPAFARAPCQVLSGALQQARVDEEIQAEFTGNLLPLIYGDDTPAFEDAFKRFNEIAEALLEALP